MSQSVESQPVQPIQPVQLSTGLLTVLDEDGETTLWECNDCGRLIPVYNDLCVSCWREEDDRREWERMVGQ